MNNKQKTFVVDLDGVLRDIFSQMIKLYNNEFGENIKPEDVKDYDVETSFPKAHATYGSSYQYFFEKHADYVFLLSPPMEGAVEAMRHLIQLGKVIVATIQPSTHNKILALKWLDKWGIPYDEIRFVDTKAGINCDYFIEDYPKNMEGVFDGFKILIDAPYNQETEEVNGWYVYRFESLERFVDWCENNKNNLTTNITVDEQILNLHIWLNEICRGCCVDGLDDCKQCEKYKEKIEIRRKLADLEFGKNK